MCREVTRQTNRATSRASHCLLRLSTLSLLVLAHCSNIATPGEVSWTNCSCTCELKRQSTLRTNYRSNSLCLHGQVPSATSDTTGAANAYAETMTDAARATRTQLLDNTAWMSDFKRAHTFIPNSLLPENEYQALFTRVYRYQHE